MAGINSVIDALRIMVPQEKSLRDSSSVAGALGQVAVVHAGEADSRNQAFKKQNVMRWRMWAEYSWCVRRALDIHRNFSALVPPDVTPIDQNRPVDAGIKKALEDLLTQRMTSGDSYADVKEKLLEDFFVVSHGVAETWLKKNGRPYNITSLDGNMVAFYRNWDGKPDSPRYAEIDSSGRIVRRFGDQHIMALINRKRSYDTLGLSHVEVLETAVQAILAGDKHLLQELEYPSASGALSLGEGIGPHVADEVRSKIMSAAKHAFLVITGSKDPKFIPFKPRDLKRLDKQLWFVREVATIFGLPISVFAQAADQNRANTTALLDQMGEGLKDTIFRLKNAENHDIVKKFGDPNRHNLQIDYPILNRKDALKQAELTAIHLADQPIATINEGRRDNGLEKINLPIADEILINTSIGIIPLTALNRELYGEDAALDEEKTSRYIKFLARSYRARRSTVDGELIEDLPNNRLLKD